MIKHVGMNRTLGTRYVIVFREVPNDPENCLIVESDGLNSLVQDNLMNAIESTECQAASHLGEALARKTFATGENMLQYLHTNGLMRKVPVADVILTPTPGTRVTLKEINAIVNGKDPYAPTPSTEAQPTAEAKPVDVTASLDKVKAESKLSDADFATALAAYSQALTQKAEEVVPVKKPRRRRVQKQA